jgi:hypothetical protein
MTTSESQRLVEPTHEDTASRKSWPFVASSTTKRHGLISHSAQLREFTSSAKAVPTTAQPTGIPHRSVADQAFGMTFRCTRWSASRKSIACRCLMHSRGSSCGTSSNRTSNGDASIEGATVARQFGQTFFTLIGAGCPVRRASAIRKEGSGGNDE